MSKKSKQKLNTVKNEKLLSRLRTILLAALVIIVFYPPYLQGLFFEKHFLPTQIFVFAVFILFLIYKWMKKDHQFFKTPIDYIAIGFVVVYFISIFVAVHTRSAILEWLKYCMYFAVFYMIASLADNLKTKLLILWTIVASAVGSSILGLDAAMGGNLVGLLNNIFRKFGAENDVFFGLFVGNRLHSTLQYPNAMASYVMAVFFIAAGLLIVSKKIWQKAIIGGCSFILFLTLMLTQSRGVQLLFPVILVIFFMVIPKGNRIKAVTQVLLLIVPAIVISLLINPYLSADELSMKALLLVLAGAIISVLLSIVSEYIGGLLQKVNWKVYVAILSAFAIIAVAAVIHIVNASVPLELSLDADEANRTISGTKDVALKPDKEYILSYQADAKRETEQPYAYLVRVFSLNRNDILFGGNSQLLREELLENNAMKENRIRFTTPEDNKLTRISFSIYYAGTNVKVDDVKIIDAETGKTVKNVILKNKYNLDSIISRFENMSQNNSLVKRLIFYKDGLKIFKRSWLVGSGGGAWDYLYRQYQSYNYASSQAHNFPLQLGIETGILGILVLLSLSFSFAFISIKYMKEINSGDNSKTPQEENNHAVFLNSAVISAIAAMLIHSVMDFDFSEAAMLLLFWQLIALFNQEVGEKLTQNDMLPIKIKQNKGKHKRSNGNRTKGAIAIGMAVTITTLAFSFSFQIASAHANKAFEDLKNENMDEAIKNINKAIKADSFNETYVIGYTPILSRPDIKAGLIDLLFMKNDMIQQKEKNGEKVPENELRLFQQQFTEANKYITKNEKRANSNLSLSSNLASYCFGIGQTEKGIAYLNKAIDLFPFEPSMWHSKVDIYYQLMKDHFNNAEYEQTKEYVDLAFRVVNEAKDVNKRNMNPFILKANTIERLQKMQFIIDYLSDLKKLKSVNEVVHYTLPNFDINLDSIPDQWRIGNAELLNVVATDEGMEIKSESRSFIFTRYHPSFKQGKTYRIEVQLKEPVDYLTYLIPGIKGETSFNREENKYTAEFLVENEPNESENQLRIYMESDCIIENIHVKELNE